MLRVIMLGMGVVGYAYGADELPRDHEPFLREHVLPFPTQKTFYYFSIDKDPVICQTTDYLDEARRRSLDVSLEIQGGDVKSFESLLSFLTPVQSLTLSYGGIRPSDLAPDACFDDDLLIQKACQTPSLSKLSTLKVQWGGLGYKSVEFISQALFSSSLQELDLSHQDIGNAGALILSRGAASLPSLKALSLQGCKINLEGLDVLMPSPLVRQLIKLNLSKNPLYNWGMQCVVNGAFENITELNLRETGAQDKEVIALVQKPVFGKLQVLNLSNNLITYKSIVAIAQSPYMSHLRTFDVSWCRIRNRGAQALSESETLSSLKELDVSGCHQISLSWQQKLKQKYPFVILEKTESY